MKSDSYARMNTQEKDQVFIEFYEKNKGNIQRFIKEKFPEQFIKEIPIGFSNKQKQTSTSEEQHLNDPC
ncbi:unnamed protein product, partial [Rotaria sp. Silwood1]